MSPVKPLKNSTPLYPPILKKSVGKLDVSEELMDFMKIHAFETLEQLLEIKAIELIKREGFSYRMLHSLLSFLEANDCIEAFQDC